MSSKNGHIKEFGNLRVDAERHILFRDGSEVAMPLKEVELLCVLLARPGELVTKNEILDMVWADSFVEESNLSRHIYLLRKRLKDLGAGDDLIETVPRRGYRFTGNVKMPSTNGNFVIERRATVQTLIEELHDTRSPGHANSNQTLLRVSIAALAGLIIVFGVFLLRPDTTVENAIVNAEGSSGFGESGLVITDLGRKWEQGYAVDVQTDGKIVVGGSVGENQAMSDFAIARYNPDGTLERSFNGNGKSVTVIGEDADLLHGLAIQPDGKIVAVGAHFTGPRERKFAVVRYKPDGSLDASFNGSGIATFKVGDSGMDTASDALILPDGKILVVGSALMPVTTEKTHLDQNDFALIRLNSDGSRDTTFGENGRSIADFGFGSDVPYAFSIDASGRIVVTGMSTASRHQDFGVARFMPDGTLDSSFGRSGMVRTDFFGDEDVSWALALQPDGKIAVGGYATRSGVNYFAVARYLNDGSPDNRFDAGGKAQIRLGDSASIRKLLILPEGSIVAAGLSVLNGRGGYGVTSLKPDGSIEGSFREKAASRFDFPEQGTMFAAVHHPSGIVIFAGTSVKDGSSDFCIARVPLN